MGGPVEVMRHIMPGKFCLLLSSFAMKPHTLLGSAGHLQDLVAVDTKQVIAVKTSHLKEQRELLCCQTNASLSPAVMALVVGFSSLAAEELWLVLPASPYFTSPVSLCITASCVMFGGCIAFLMVWAEFSVIQETSALTFMVAGTFKEIVTGNLLLRAVEAAFSASATVCCHIKLKKKRYCKPEATKALMNDKCTRSSPCHCPANESDCSPM